MKSAPIDAVTRAVHSAGDVSQFGRPAPQGKGAGPQMQSGDPELVRTATENIRAIAALLGGDGSVGVVPKGGATFRPHQIATATLPIDAAAGTAEALQAVYRRALAAESISPPLRRQFIAAVAALLGVAQPQLGAVGQAVAQKVADKLLGDIADFREAVAAQVAAEAGLAS